MGDAASQASDGGLKRVTIRIPTTLHDGLARRRQESGKSLNDILVEAIAAYLDVPVPTINKGIPGPKPKAKR